MPIRLLDETIAAQIAAGEVVERPASVVKELVENALDAGARRIVVEARGGGLREIRVQDDGCGIPADEVELAFARHATSKLQSAEDLWAIRTLGFRGEALPSIASVAQVICVTRVAEAELGVELRIAGGEVQSRLPCGCPVGTTITVRNLFYNTPVRREYLRSEATETGAISAIVQQYALAYPEVSFSLVVDGRVMFQTAGDGDLRAVAVELYGLEVGRALLPVQAEAGADELWVAVRGLISPPDLTRSSRSYLSLFANRRALQPRGALAAVVENAYHTMLMKGRFPIAILDLRVHPAAIDVNVHPTKSEVKFRYAAHVHSVLGRAIRDALISGADIPVWDAPDPATAQRRFELRRLGQEPPSPSPSAWGVGAAAWDRDRSRWDAGAPAAHLATPLPLPPAAEPVAPEPSAPVAPAVAMPNAAPASTPSALPPLRVVGQVGLTYIVAEAPEGMYLIDQHAAHERITYEKLMNQYAQRAVETQQLLLPQAVELSPEASALLLGNAEKLAEWGFALEPWGTGVLVRAMPATLPLDELAQALHEMAERLAGRGGSSPLEWREAMLITLACHTSVRAGQPLSHEEMRQLIRQLEQCASPRTCPHGRPTMILMTPAQLERQFGRRV
ncbi:DNA mismatch repair protein MutL [Chloroflexus islandicus]|uniref:DNA mismatch repair protein MutL n=1 Tax=Chloroflexus islandicus TaxID=1707952 RepID=A0A178MGT0_9CHLR|nr:DNA mismatch repair endonuclease MutL [Chloroflexus islandicus]OAN47347.1 DNA mismatch repair protein MutL [Chloroflexus islandicus]